MAGRPRTKLPTTLTQIRREHWSPRNEAREKYLKARSRASNYTKKPEVRERIFSRDGYKCLKCGVTDDLTIDHIKHVWAGGTNNDDNLRTLCRSCNSSR